MQTFLPELRTRSLTVSNQTLRLYVEDSPWSFVSVSTSVLHAGESAVLHKVPQSSVQIRTQSTLEISWIQAELSAQSGRTMMSIVPMVVSKRTFGATSGKLNKR